MLYILTLVTNAAYAEAPEHPVDAVPPGVLAAIEARWPGAKVAEAEPEHGKLELEVHPTDGGALEVIVDEAGTIIEVHEEKSDGQRMGELPQAIRTAVEARWPGSTLEEAEEKRDGAVEIELVTAQGARIEALVAATGEVLREKQEKREKREKHEGERDER